MSGKQGALSKKATQVKARFDERFVKDMDGRSEIARLLRDRLQLLAADLGGWETLSYQERSVAKRAIHTEWWVERGELRLALGQKVDGNLHLNCVNTLSGQWTKLGMKRRVKILALGDYLAAKATPATPIKPACPVKVVKATKEPA